MPRIGVFLSNIFIKLDRCFSGLNIKIVKIQFYYLGVALTEFKVNHCDINF